MNLCLKTLIEDIMVLKLPKFSIKKFIPSLLRPNTKLEISKSIFEMFNPKNIRIPYKLEFIFKYFFFFLMSLDYKFSISIYRTPITKQLYLGIVYES